jgi:Ca2+-binding RTX toxin-like protein
MSDAILPPERRFDGELIGTPLPDRMTGGAGDELIHGCAGRDAIDGGDGIDVVDYGASALAVQVQLAGSPNASGYTDLDVRSNVEGVLGLRCADILTAHYASYGGSDPDGRAGDGTARGTPGPIPARHDGDDRIVGIGYPGHGGDVLFGGAGDDAISALRSPPTDSRAA